jgi:hypothetical protein
VRKATIAAIAIIAATCVGVALAAATGTFESGENPADKYLSPAGRPVIRPLSTDPLRIKGTGFKPGERVILAAKGAANRSRRSVTAGDRGSFVAKLGSAGCDSLTVYAIGNRGSRASFNFSSFVCGQ